MGMSMLLRKSPQRLLPQRLPTHYHFLLLLLLVDDLLLLLLEPIILHVQHIRSFTIAVATVDLQIPSNLIICRAGLDPPPHLGRAILLLLRHLVQGTGVCGLEARPLAPGPGLRVGSFVVCCSPLTAGRTEAVKPMELLRIRGE